LVEVGAALADALGVESEEPEESCETTVQAPKPAVDFTDCNPSASIPAGI
jgi:hypothetical protein